MKFILGVIFFFFAISLLGGIVLFWKLRKQAMAFRDAMQDSLKDEEFQRMADKNYYRKQRDNGPQFDADYFDGDDSQQRQRQQQQQKKQQRRTTRTRDGVTVIDDRDPSVAERKIFTADEGEYVDFKEA
jgi:hypothetical protein